MDRHLLTLDQLATHVLRVAGAGRHDVDVVAACDEAGGEALREAGGAVDVGREGVGTDQDPEPIGSLGPISRFWSGIR